MNRTAKLSYSERQRTRFSRYWSMFSQIFRDTGLQVTSEIDKEQELQLKSEVNLQRYH